jgi:DNA-binding CsgD family transcriptional regulator/quercetin dioxygenase-like cupin family protein
MSPSQPTASAFELLVLDPAGRIRFGNARANAWLARGDGVRRANGAMAAEHRGSRDALTRLLRLTLDDAKAQLPARPRVMPLPRPGRLPLIAVALPITGGRCHADFELGAAVLLRDPEAIALPPADVAREVFGLTAAEAAVALALAADRTLKEIASERRCSVNTVRTLIGRVFDKTGCRRQSELVRVIGALNDALSAGSGLASGLALAGQPVFDRIAASHLRALLQLPLHAPPNQHATIVARGFAPGDRTGFHLHGCGHEIVCVLDGSLTMQYVDTPAIDTRAGEAIYVAPGVVHQGVNTSADGALTLFHIGIGPAGSIDRRNLGS